MSGSQDFNIAMSFSRIARMHPDHQAILAADITLTYAKLWRIVRGFAVKMQRHGIDRQAIVAVHTTDMIVAIATMLATSLLGARYATLEPQLIGHPAIKPTHCLRSPDVAALSGVTYQMIEADWSGAALPESEGHEPEFPGYADAADPWWILHTSGTTGRPKYLMISQKVVHCRSIAVRSDFQPFTTRFCPLFPCFTRPFFVRATAALLNACTIIDSIDIAFLQAHKVNLVCGSPRTAVEWLGDRVITPKIPLLQVSGQKLADGDAVTLLHSFDAVEDVYGSSETNKSFVNAKLLSEGQLVTHGRPQDSEVQIVGEDGKPCAQGVKGTLRIRNTYMADGYVDEPEATTKSFRDGWFYPGDIGFWGHAGALCVEGRSDDVINLGGLKIDPEAVESLLCSAAGISSAAAFRDPADLTPPRLMAMVTLSSGAHPDTCIPDAHRACKDRLGYAATPHIIYVVKSIPMTIDGSPHRAECQRMARSLSK